MRIKRAKDKAEKDAEKAEDLARKTAILMGLEETSDPEKLDEERSELPYNKNDERSGHKELAYSCVAKKNSVKIQEGKMKNFEEFVEFLRVKSKEEVKEKDAVMLINTTSFKKKNDVPVGRRRMDVASASAIWLDIDKGNKCPIEYAQLFKGTEMVVCTSFSSKDDDKRWRAIFPLSRDVNADEYNQIAIDLIGISSNEGYNFDKTKKQPSDFFYLPCRSVGSNHHVFEYYASDERKKIDVDEWLYSETKTTKVDENEPGPTLTITSTDESDSVVPEKKKKDDDAPDDRKNS